MNILIVEDDPDYNKLLCIILQRLNVFVDSAKTLDKGLEFIINNNYDVVFIDGNLNIGTSHNNDWAGVEIAKTASEKKMYTVGISSEPKIFREKAGNHICFNHQKPFTPKEIKRIVYEKPLN